MPDAPERPFPESLCHECIHHRLVRGARSSFLHCDAPGLPKYPRQPVLECVAFSPASAGH